jgi:hypothetical protein
MSTALGRAAASAFLVALMAVGSIFMWIGLPVLWLYGAAQLYPTSQPSFVVYVGVLVAICVSMALMGKLLAALNRWHMRVTGQLPGRREQTIWLKSMRGDAAAQRQHGILAPIMVISVGIALVLMGIWFLLFAEGGGI